MKRTPTVAVIDIGSNSIKLLVAAPGPDGDLVTLAHWTEETRIGKGITGSPPRLHPDAMQRAVESVQALLCTARPFEPARIEVVATSAVRDAANRQEFADLLLDTCGVNLRVLTGEQEAQYIARGIASDPGMRDEPDFYLFDLGGGSLEMLTIHEGAVLSLASLSLGCVRVTEKLVPDPTKPLSRETMQAIRDEVRTVIEHSGFIFNLPQGSRAVVTGGTATVFRAMKAAASAKPIEAIDPVLSLVELIALAETLAAEDLEARRRRPGLPSERADVMPAALLTLVEAARLAGVSALHHSFFNLRYGLAVELLAAGGGGES